MSHPPSSSPSTAAASCWRFGPFEADAREQQLRRDGVPVPLMRKAFALLLALLARPGRLVSKAELFDSVWAGTVVTDAALSRAIRELRVALGDDAATPTYIATAHGLGFRFVAEVTPSSGWLASPPAAAEAAPAVGLPQAYPASALPPDHVDIALDTPDPVNAPPPATAVVGREAELAQLHQALARAAAGQRQLVFLTGEAGIGKTALAQAFCAQAQAAGALVAAGRCIEQFGAAEPALPLLDALESLAAWLGQADLRELLLRLAPHWWAQLPGLAPGADAAERAYLQQILVDSSSQRLLREWAQLLEHLGQADGDRPPLVLWLEDLHWSDPTTLDTLAFFAGRREAARVVVLASLRPPQVGQAAPAQAWMQRLLQAASTPHSAVYNLTLTLWDTATTAGFVVHYLQRRDPSAAPMAPATLAQLGNFLQQRTEGHALFTQALLDALRQRGELGVVHGRWTLAQAVDQLGTALPDNLRALVQSQMDRLIEPDRRLVEAAAVAGTRFSAAAVAAALQEPLAEVEERCLSLADVGGLLRREGPIEWPDGTVAAGFAFVHALVWQGAFERTALARRAQWQALIALREEQAYGAQVAHIATELALRFEVARDIPRSLKYLQMAGAQALARCAYAEGQDLLLHGLSLVPRLPLAEQGATELALLLPLGAAQMAAQGYAADAVARTYEQALKRCRAAPASTKPSELERVLRGLWNVALVRAELGAARLHADELVVQAAAKSASGARGHAQRWPAMFDAFAKQGQTSMHLGQFDAARHHLEHALAMPLPADDPTRVREAPRVLGYLAWVQWYLGHADAALATAQQALALLSSSTSPHTAAFVLGFAGWVHGFRDEPASMHQLAQRQALLAEEHGLAYWGSWSRMLLGLAQARLALREPAAQAPFELYRPSPAEPGACQRGLQVAAAAIAEFEAAGARVGVSHFLCELADVQFAAGEPAQAQANAQRSLTLLQDTGNAYHAADTWRVLGRLALAQGDTRAARTAFDQARQTAQHQAAKALGLRVELTLAA